VLAFVEITLIWQEKYTKKKTTKRHYHDNIKHCDILTRDNRHQLFLISPIPNDVQLKVHVVLVVKYGCVGY